MRTFGMVAMVAVFGIASTTAVVGCGDDDDDTTSSSSGTSGTSGTSSGTSGTSSGTSGTSSGTSGTSGPASFPVYVKTTIETKTNATGTPDPEAVWGPLADDDKFVYPATFF